jgi:hypothetical protein
MGLSYVPLLATQLEVYQVPLGVERFKTYIKTILNEDSDDIELAPLAEMNPMAKDHVKVYLERLLELGADSVAAKAVQDFIHHKVSFNPYDIRVSLVVVDDAKGGWTNRYLNDFQYAFGFDKTSFLKRPWLMVPCWTNEETLSEKIYNDTLMYLHRLAYVFEKGQAKTLGQRMRQEGHVLASVTTKQWLSEDDLVYSREVIQPFLGSTEKPVQVACLYGNEAAKSVGYQPLGLSHRAGFAVALEDALRQAQGTLTAP